MGGTRTDSVPRQREGAEEAGADARDVYVEDARDPGGRTDIATGAIEKASVQAVREVTGADPVRSRPARARTSGGAVMLRLRIAVHYPGPLREVSGRVREHVRSRIERITGRGVDHIDIEIAELVR